MTALELLERAAAAVSRREALLLVLEAWRVAPSPELAALVRALDLGEEREQSGSFHDEVSTRDVAERGSLAWSAGISRERLEALRSWLPDPRVSAVVEEIAWKSSDRADEVWAGLEVLRTELADPVTEAAIRIAVSFDRDLGRSPGLHEREQYLLSGLGGPAAAHARSVASSYFQAPEELAVIHAHPDDDAPRLVYADALQERGDPRGAFIVEQCRHGKLEFRSNRQWLGRLAPVLRGERFGFRRGFLAETTVRFRHPAEVELFGSLPEWRTLEHLSWESRGIDSCRFIGPQMQQLRSAHHCSFELLMSAQQPWSRLESVTLDLDEANFAALHASPLFPRLRSVAIPGGTLRSFDSLRITKWSTLEFGGSFEGYEELIEALSDSSLETVRLRECELRRGSDGAFSRLTLRTGDWLSSSPSARRLSLSLPQGIFESVDFEDDQRMDAAFRAVFEPNRRGRAGRHRPNVHRVIAHMPLAWTEGDELLLHDYLEKRVVVCRPDGEELRSFAIPGLPTPSRNGRWVASRAGDSTEIFDTLTGQQVAVLHAKGELAGISNDGDRVLMSHGGRGELWKCSSATLEASEECDIGTKLLLDPVDARWATFAERFFVRVTGAVLDGSAGIEDLVFVRSNRLAGCSRTGGVMLWDLATRRVVAARPELGGLKLVASADGSTLCVEATDQLTYTVLDAATLETRCEFRVGRLSGVLLSPDGRTFAGARPVRDNERILQVFDVGIPQAGDAA